MPIIAKCPSCGTTFNVPDHLAGRQVKCSKCAKVLVIPPPGPQKQASTAPPTIAPPTVAGHKRSGQVPGTSAVKPAAIPPVNPAPPAPPKRPFAPAKQPSIGQAPSPGLHANALAAQGRRITVAEAAILQAPVAQRKSAAITLTILALVLIAAVFAAALVLDSSPGRSGQVDDIVAIAGGGMIGIALLGVPVIWWSWKYQRDQVQAELDAGVVSEMVGRVQGNPGRGQTIHGAMVCTLGKGVNLAAFSDGQEVVCRVAPGLRVIVSVYKRQPQPIAPAQQRPITSAPVQLRTIANVPANPPGQAKHTAGADWASFVDEVVADAGQQAPSAGGVGALDAMQTPETSAEESGQYTVRSLDYNVEVELANAGLVLKPAVSFERLQSIFCRCADEGKMERSKWFGIASTNYETASGCRHMLASLFMLAGLVVATSPCYWEMLGNPIVHPLEVFIKGFGIRGTSGNSGFWLLVFWGSLCLVLGGGAARLALTTSNRPKGQVPTIQTWALVALTERTLTLIPIGITQFGEKIARGYRVLGIDRGKVSFQSRPVWTMDDHIANFVVIFRPEWARLDVTIWQSAPADGKLADQWKEAQEAFKALGVQK